MTQRRRARCARRNGGNYGKLRKEAGRLTGLLASSDASRTGIVQRETGGAFDVPPRFAVALARHRAGGMGNFLMEWDPQTGLFVDPFRLRLPVGRSAPSVVSSTAPSEALARMGRRQA